jgi:DNA invertase Pin-like site-specific DNA recombinase
MIEPHPTAPKRAAFYPRVSKTGKRDAVALARHTLGEQRELAEPFLPRGVVFVEDARYVDVNVSGRHSERRGLEAVFDDVESGRVDAVVVGYLSRFGRNARELLENVERLSAAGATLYSARELLIIPPGTKGPAKMILTVLAAVAEMESDRLADGLARANRTAIDSGVSIQVPYGYRRSNGNGSTLVEDDERAEVVRHIFELAADGVGASAIAEELNARAVPAPRGGRWKHNSVRAIIATHTYRGVIPRAVAWTGEGRKRQPSAWECLPGAHDALVDDDTWHAAQSTGRRAVRNGTSAGSLLQGLVRCVSCSQTMRPSKSGTTLTYSCRGRRHGCERPASITRAPLDEYVVHELFDGASFDESREQRADELDVAEAALDAAQGELDAFERNASAAQLGDRYMPVWLAKVSARDEAQALVIELRRGATPAQTITHDDFAALPLDDQRDVLRSLLDAVIVAPAPGRGQRGAMSERVVELVGRGRAPFELSATGRRVAPRPWPRRHAD